MLRVGGRVFLLGLRRVVAGLHIHQLIEAVFFERLLQARRHVG
jgi:hypothetical protein